VQPNTLASAKGAADTAPLQPAENNPQSKTTIDKLCALIKTSRLAGVVGVEEGDQTTTGDHTGDHE
jgi:hypothetical protein